MNDFTTELLKTLLEGKDITEIFRYHVECAVNQLLQYELREFLEYDKYDHKGFNSGNSRNGYYERTLKTKYGDLSLKISRDRNGEFENQTLTPNNRQNDIVESMIIHLYSHGMTTEEIARIIEKMYSHHYTKQTVSSINAAVVGDIQTFNHRALSKRYAVIYLDATHLPVRRDTVTKEALYFALGITPEGYKKILSYSLFPTEYAYSWEIVLSDSRVRGIEESLLFVTDCLTGIRDAISNVFPKAKHQSCWVHLARNVSHAVRVKDRDEVLSDLKAVYTQEHLRKCRNRARYLHQHLG